MQKNKFIIEMGLINRKRLIYCFFMLPFTLIANEKFNLEQIEKSIKNEPEKQILAKRQINTKNRQVIESLIGTWSFSYTLGTSSPTTYTDIIVLDNVTVSLSGDLIATGLYKTFNSATQEILCKQIQPGSSFFSTQFNCLTSNKNLSFYQAFIFKFSENTIIKGSYGQGNTGLNATSHASLGITPISGYRESEPVSMVDEKQVVYNEVNGKLVIPLVKYINDYYSVVLQNQGDFIFTLQSVNMIVPEGGIAIENIYDESMDDLILSNLKYDGQNYYVILHNQGEFVFSLLSAELLR